MIDGAPAEVLDAVNRLACTTCVLVNIGVSHADLSQSHMTYFYDEDICFSRIGFPSHAHRQQRRPSHGQHPGEVYFSAKYKPFTGAPEDWIEPVIKDLRRYGCLREADGSFLERAMLLPYANIIFDHDRLLP